MNIRPRFPSLPLVLLVGLALANGASSVGAAGAGGIEGLVRDTRGQLLAGARVRVTQGRFSASGLTGPDGAYAIAGIPARSGFTVRATARRHKPGEQAGVEVLADGNTRVDFALAPLRGADRGRIHGVVRDPLGRPVRGAKIDILDGPTDGHATSARNGRFRLHGLAPGGYSLTVAASGFATRVVTGIQVRNGSPAVVEVDLAQADEGEPGILFGRVRNAAGRPLPGALVEIAAGPSEGSATTDEDGGYEIGGLSPGAYALRASAEGYLGNTWDGIQLAAGHHARVDFALRTQDEPNEFGAIAGHVTDGEGHAITGATVQVMEGSTRRSARTNGEGKYRLDDLGVGQYLIQAAKEGFHSARGEAEVRAAKLTELHFVLEREPPTHGAIAGHVHDAEGHAIVGATVEVIDGPTRRSARTDREGIYRLVELLPGGYLLRAGKDGFESSREDAEVRAGHTTELRFVLEREPVTHGAIAGHVKDGEGHPIAGATVEVIDGPARRSVRTGKEGAYRLPELLAGDYVVRASKDGFESGRAETEVQAGKTTELHFILRHEPPSHGAIAGRVKDAKGRAIVGALVEVIDGPTRQSARTGKEGAYRLPELLAGEYVVRAGKDGFESSRAEAVVHAGKPTELHFVLAREPETHGAIAGHVVDGEGHAIAGATVEVIDGPTRRSVRTDRKGVYRLPELLAGDYVVGAGKDAFEGSRAETEVQAGHTTELHFTLHREPPSHGAIAGHVKNATGQPVADATVEVIDGPTRRRVQTDRKGAYRLVELLPGAYIVRAGKDGFQSIRAEADVVAGETAEVHFVLKGK